MANPILKPTAPGYANIVAALWISDQIDVAGTPTKGAWDAKNGVFYPAHGASSLTPFACGSTGRNGLTSSAAACGIELAATDAHTGTIWDVVGPEMGMLVVGAKSASTGTAIAVQNRNSFGSAEGWSLEFSSTATVTAKCSSSVATNTAVATGPATADELAAFLYRRQAATYQQALAKNGTLVSNASAGGDFGVNYYGNTQRRAALFGYSASRQAAVNAVPCTLCLVVIWDDMTWCEATSSEPSGTTRSEWAAIGTSNAELLAGSHYTAFLDFADSPTGPTIDTQPTPQAANEGATAVFTIAATTSGGTMSRQWKRQAPGGGAFANVGTDSNTYTTAALDCATDHGAQVYCAVTDDNGTTDTDTVGLTVRAITTTSRPAADVDTTGWTASAGTDFFALIDETTYSLTDYIDSPTITGAADWITLDLDYPRATGDHVIPVWASVPGGTGTLKVRLEDDSATVVGSAADQAVTGTATRYDLPVTISGPATRVSYAFVT